MLATGTAPAGLRLGTRAEPALPRPEAGASGIDAGALAQLFFALILVAALVRWGLPKLLGLWADRASAKASPSFRIEETLALPEGRLHVVSVRGRTLLLGAGPHGWSCLADLTAPAAAPDREEEPPAFFELADEAKAKPISDLRAAVVHPPEEELVLPPGIDVREGLERLRKLGA